MKLRPFSARDWLAFAGAQPFADGSAPLIGHTTIDDAPADVVLDGYSLSVFIGDFEVLFDGMFAARAVALLASVPSMTLTELRAMPGAQNAS